MGDAAVADRHPLSPDVLQFQDTPDHGRRPLGQQCGQIRPAREDLGQVDYPRRSRRSLAAKVSINLSLLPGAAATNEITVYGEWDRPAGGRVDERIAPPRGGRIVVSLPAGGGLLVHVNSPPAPPPLQM